MENDKVVRIFAVASGRVQGVGFRYFVQTTALNRSVTGWVKNMNDGTVEMELQGAETNVEHLFAAIKKGNMFCRVDSLTMKKLETDLQEGGFHITY
ncbi:MAG: acylphosphatase [Firmicutes bacterium]|nr:acylphosphatase [Bacillota bacterium]